MIYGANWTSPRHLSTVRALLKDKRISFCEVMVDNFLHLSPENILSAFPGVPLSFHIMNSHFLTRDAGELKALAAKVKSFARELRPMYVSDHLAVFSHEGRRLPFPQEVDYESDYALVRERVLAWQELLGAPLLLENYPSILDSGRAQAEFMGRLLKETGAELLFDFSNAVVARENCGAPLEAWEPLVRGTLRFHAAGYRPAGTVPDFILDSHDCAPSGATLAFLRRSKAQLQGRECSLVVERDANIDAAAWSTDIAAVAGAAA
ncbi:MAG: DUF692 family multinuclear iron-containing protein [Elusimicrobiota bacterium]